MPVIDTGGRAEPQQVAKSKLLSGVDHCVAGRVGVNSVGVLKAQRQHPLAQDRQ
jgi:hypothetical protein